MSIGRKCRQDNTLAGQLEPDKMTLGQKKYVGL